MYNTLTYSLLLVSLLSRHLSLSIWATGQPHSCYLHLVLRNLIGQIHEKALLWRNIYWTGVLELQKRNIAVTKSHTLTEQRLIMSIIHHWYSPEGRILAKTFSSLMFIVPGLIIGA